MRMKEDAMNNGQTKPGYNLQTDTENQFIIDFQLFPNPTDTLTLILFFHSFRHRYNRLPGIGVADSGYGSEENYRFMQENGIEAFVKYNYFHKEQRPRYTPNPFHTCAKLRKVGKGLITFAKSMLIGLFINRYKWKIATSYQMNEKKAA